MLLPANEAREMAMKVIESLQQKQLDCVIESINKSISEGRFRIAGKGTLYKDVRMQLESYGYEILVGSNPDGRYYIIQW